MRTERLIALSAFPYANESLKTGDSFLAELGHAKILKAIGRAKDDPAPAMTASTTAKPEPVVIAPPAPAPVGEVKIQPPWQANAKAASKPKKTQE